MVIIGLRFSKGTFGANKLVGKFKQKLMAQINFYPNPTPFKTYDDSDDSDDDDNCDKHNDDRDDPSCFA